MWLKFGQTTYPYDKNFMEVSEYALNNDIDDLKPKKIVLGEMYNQEEEDIKRAVKFLNQKSKPIL